MDAVLALPPAAGITDAACTPPAPAPATAQRGRARRTRPPAEPAPRPNPPRALTAEERLTVLDRLREPRFADLAPAEVYATLLDEGIYLCSIRTMYRILDDHDEVRERRDQLRHPARRGRLPLLDPHPVPLDDHDEVRERRDQLRHPVYTKPELLAEGPDQIWS